MRFLSKLLPEGSRCGGCGRQLYEWKRHPCPYCGAMIRNYGRFTREYMMSKDTTSTKVQK